MPWRREVAGLSLAAGALRRPGGGEGASWHGGAECRSSRRWWRRSPEEEGVPSSTSRLGACNTRNTLQQRRWLLVWKEKEREKRDRVEEK